MALSDKNILITPNIGQAADPKIVFSGADASTAAQNITLQVYPTNSGTLSFEGSAGQLFSITNSLSGTIYSVNDVSGIPSIEVLDTGLVKLAQYSGNVLLGTGTDNATDKLQVNGSITSTVLKSSVATGTAPLTVASTTLVTNLNADMVEGLHVHTGTNNEANKIVRTDANGYIQAGWINSTSGDNGTTAITRVYASSDGYIRYYSLANFGAQLTNLNASSLASGTVPTARLGSGTASSSTFLRGDNTWATPPTGTTWVRKTANYTAVVGDSIIADTSGGAFTITLPASPSTGNSVTIADGATWGTNNLTIARNGSTIEGVADDITVDITGLRLDLIYDGTTWEVFAAGGASAVARGGGSDQVFFENGTSVNSNYSITTGMNAMSAGPITIMSSAVVTIPNGSTWTIV